MILTANSFRHDFFLSFFFRVVVVNLLSSFFAACLFAVAKAATKHTTTHFADGSAFVSLRLNKLLFSAFAKKKILFDLDKSVYIFVSGRQIKCNITTLKWCECVCIWNGRKQH